MSDIGFVGLGKMGLPILKRISSGFKVKMVYNRNKSKASGLQGVRVAEEPFLVGTGCDIVFVMLSDDAACETVIFGENGLHRTLKPQSILVNLSTVSHDFTLSAHRRLAGNMCRYIDAPVLGSIGSAEAGTLTCLASGDEKAYNTVSEIIKTFSEKTFYLGATGNAIRMKLISNMVMAVNMAAIGEALVMSEKSGIQKETAIDIINSSGGESRVLSLKKETLLSETYEPNFTLKDMSKDLGYASDLAQKLMSPSVMASAAGQFYLAALSIGIGNLDFSSVARVFRFMIGRS